jgi:hypothetical protein
MHQYKITNLDFGLLVVYQRSVRVTLEMEAACSTKTVVYS